MNNYKKVKNVIHNDIGITKEEILEVFRQIAKDEIQNISKNKEFIYECFKEVIHDEMFNAVKDHTYPKIKGNIWRYPGKDSFEDFMVGIMREEIISSLWSKFDITMNVETKEDKNNYV